MQQHDTNFIQKIDTKNYPLSQIADNTFNVDSQFGQTPYWKNELHDENISNLNKHILNQRDASNLMIKSPAATIGCVTLRTDRFLDSKHTSNQYILPI